MNTETITKKVPKIDLGLTPQRLKTLIEYCMNAKGGFKFWCNIIGQGRHVCTLDPGKFSIAEVKVATDGVFSIISKAPDGRLYEHHLMNQYELAQFKVWYTKALMAMERNEPPPPFQNMLERRNQPI